MPKTSTSASLGATSAAFVLAAGLSAGLGAGLVGPRALAAPAGAAQTFSVSAVSLEDFIGSLEVRTSDRADVSVALDPGSGAIASPTLSEREGVLEVRGEPYRKGSCHGGRDGYSVRLDGGERRPLSELPNLVIEAPRRLSLSIKDGLVLGSVGDVRVLLVELAGCGDLTVGDVAEDADIEVSGSSDILVGAIGDAADLKITGSGDIRTGAVGGDLNASISGSGDIVAASLAGGDFHAAVMGSGDIKVAGGTAQRIQASIMGSGDIAFGGETVDAELSVMGSGDLRVRKVTGAIRQRRFGSGSIEVSE